MRLLFVARAIDNMAGGLERMIIAIMNAMTTRHEVSLFTWDREKATAFYPMSADITWRRLNIGDPRRKASMRLVLARVPKVRRIVKELSPDVIVCFQGGQFRAMQLYTAGMGIPLIAAERTAPTLYDHANSPRTRFLEHLAFTFATRITIQFERYRDLYPTRLRSRMVTIPNPVPLPTQLARPDLPGANGRWMLLSIGRLGYQKNYSVLIDAFEQLAPRFPNWDLRIVGEGEDRGSLESRVSEDLKGRIILPGATTEVDAEYAAAHLFCLPSRWEGFPNAMAEALAHGVPAVGFAGCAGIPDLIEVDYNGALAEGNGDAAALAKALAPLMENGGKRAQLGRNAVASVSSYKPEAIFDVWEETFQQCVKIESTSH